MDRIPEPELMLDPAQALAYARADFEEPHGRIVATFFERFPDLPPQGTLIDLGCGPGDITLRLARRLEGWRVDGLDGSPAMLRLAREALGREPALAGRVRFLDGRLPEAPPASARYDAIFSNSLLHHLPEPAALWATLRRCAAPGAAVFVADLFRPPSEEAARALVELHAVGEPDVLRRDFFNSLRAAFTPEEVSRQLEAAGLDALGVEVISDRHLVVWGRVA